MDKRENVNKEELKAELIKIKEYLDLEEHRLTRLVEEKETEGEDIV